MKELSGDPYEGARRAYQVIHPNATSEGWESWLAESNKQANGNFDNFKSLANLCCEATASGVDMEPGVAQHVSYAAGYFDAMESVIHSLLRTLPISSCVPHHERRYKASLVNPDAQFD